MGAEEGIPRNAEEEGVYSPRGVRSGGNDGGDGAEEARPSDGHHESDDRCRPSARDRSQEPRWLRRQARSRPRRPEVSLQSCSCFTFTFVYVHVAHTGKEMPAR